MSRPTGRPTCRSLGSPAWAGRGLVAATRHLAARAGRDVLGDGGNAVGTVIVAATLAAVYPDMTRIGGDGFWSGDRAGRDRAANAMLGRMAAIARARNLSVAVARIHDLPACPCDPVLMDVMDAAAVDAGQPVRRLVSGAGHDAMVMAGLCPVVMLFIRCRDGISHHPAEHVDPADAEIALRVMSRFIERLGAAQDR